MITIRIGDSERTIQQFSPSWLREQIGGRRDSDEAACVVVDIRVTDVDLRLATPGCASSGGSCRSLTRKEQAIVQLWKDRGLNSPDFEVGHLIAFLNQLKHMA